ncbi:major facilitator superfamily domain-containing protein [Mucidula mucida]|nr:major facilitator superfamily domain-containing protein [Mucidula mucida]
MSVKIEEKNNQSPSEPSSSHATARSLTPTSPEPFSIYTPREKWFIVSLIAFGGLFSPFTANIYLPAIPALTRAFHKSTELINVTIGRRPIFSGCLLILSLSCIGLALVPTSAYWLLVVLRCVQAAGSASTIALGAGVIGDIATPVERGGFFGIYNIGPNLGPALGPVIGGLLSDHMGWRAIFWFLSIASMTCFVILVLFLPETLRAIVGNGATVPSKIYRPLIPVVGRTQGDKPPNTQCATKKPFRNPLLLLKHWDIVLLLVMNGVVSSLYYGAVADARGQDEDSLDIRTEQGVAQDFPIEKARLRLVPYLMLAMTASLAGYGWCVEKKVNLAGPLLLQAAVGFVAMAVMSADQTLIIDWVPNQSSSVTACNNLLRCTMGAALVAVMDVILDGIGAGWTIREEALAEAN